MRKQNSLWCQGSDESFYKDCRQDFHKDFETAASLGTEMTMLIKAQFNSRSKSEIIKISSELSVPFELRWSCYYKGLKHCRKCMSCVNPRRAVSQASVGDTTEYEK